jgi:hypothetical protein
MGTIVITTMLAECANCGDLAEYRWLNCDWHRERDEVCDDYECLTCGARF